MNYILDLPAGCPVPPGPSYLVDGKETVVPYRVTSRYKKEGGEFTALGVIPTEFTRLALIHRSPYELTEVHRASPLGGFRGYRSI